jgi:hypothetical protein
MLFLFYRRNLSVELNKERGDGFVWKGGYEFLIFKFFYKYNFKNDNINITKNQ